MSRSDRKPSRRAMRHASTQRRRTVQLVATAALGVAVVLIVTLVLVRGISGSGHSATAAWSSPPYVGGPRLAVDRTLIDEGSVTYDHEVSATYRLKNVGDKPLALQSPSVDIVEGC